MPNFSETSLARLKTCDKKIQSVFSEVIETWDCTIICGHRTEEDQNDCFAKGLSKAKWLESPHNYSPSMAVDALAYPLDWEDVERNSHFAGIVLGIARARGVHLTWGRDWDRDLVMGDQKFLDYPHFELTNWKQNIPMRLEEL